MALRKSKSEKISKEDKWDIERFEKAPWILLFTLAIARDILDIIPVIHLIASLFFTPFFLYFSFRYLKKTERVLIFVAISLDFIPFIAMLPATTGSCAIAYILAKQKHDKAVEKSRKTSYQKEIETSD